MVSAAFSSANSADVMLVNARYCGSGLGMNYECFVKIYIQYRAAKFICQLLRLEDYQCAVRLLSDSNTRVMAVCQHPKIKSFASASPSANI
jgi:hypothetical protein